MQFHQKFRLRRPSKLPRLLQSTLESSTNKCMGIVPKHDDLTDHDLKSLQSFVDKFRNLFVITGAGISTESGIPDYRSEGVGLYARSNYRPMKIQEFLASPQARQRYWARNFLGWPHFSASLPNTSHYTVNDWKAKGKIRTLVTQNVDGLHKKAGTTDAVELHGTAYTVICIDCTHQLTRIEFQKILEMANLQFNHPCQRRSEIRPDGDIHLDSSEVLNFVLPGCPSCHTGILQPDIVFFGANVKREKVDNIYAQLNRSDAMIVLGSSLQVFSSLRFVLRGKEAGLPLAIVTLGETRADHLANLKINARLGQILPLIKV